MTPSIKPPLAIGTYVKWLGAVSAVATIRGERYYWLVSRSGVVAMLPASLVEQAAAPLVPDRQAD